MPRDWYDEWLPVHREWQQQQWETIAGALRRLPEVREPFEVDQLQHALQMATLVERETGDEELVLCALCHDVGKLLAYKYHGEIAAEMLRPFISETNYHVVRVHQDFECYHVGAHNPPLAVRRERHLGAPWFDLAVQFSEWDQASFDPQGKAKHLEEFLPLVKSRCVNAGRR